VTATPLRVHAFEPRSRANGPGVRAVLWLQGCSLGCAGCYNPTTHSGDGGEVRAPRVVIEDIARLGDAIEGVSISGGEPFEQPEALLELLRLLRGRTGLSVLVFSGFTIDELRATDLGPEILSHVDVLIDGRYQAPMRLARGLRGSRNQSIHLLTDRYTLAEVEATPVAEIRIDAHGNVTATGVDPVKLKGL
jgi:anaerobic ribonucleoside-triphosphate reductase activating protein